MAFDFYDWDADVLFDGEAGGDDKKELLAAIKSGLPFDTEWHGWKHSEMSMRIVRDDDGLHVSVASRMDSAFEQWDLILDCLTDEECDKLTEEMVDEIRDLLCMGDFVEEITETETLPTDATFSDIITKAKEMMEYCDDRLTESFNECIGATLSIMYGYSDDTVNMVEERIDKISRRPE